jgi:HSP20 family protein
MSHEEKKEIAVSAKKEIQPGSGEPITQGVLFVPEVDITENQDGVTLTADLPGVRKEDLDVDYREGVLTLTARVEGVPSHHRLTYQEYEVGGFQRRFTVGERVDVGKIEANLKHGVLTLFLPRAEEHKPRKIEIKA